MITAFFLFAFFVILAPFLREAMRRPVDTDTQAKAPGQFIETPQGATHYVWDGPEGGPVLVLVHGLTSPLYVWDAVVPGLTALGFRVLRYDNFGRGFSDRVRSDDPAYLVEQLEGVLSALVPSGRVSLMGYSMGARIATEFAARHANRIEHLCLVAPAGMVHRLSRAQRLARDIPGFGEWYFRWLGLRALRQTITAQTDGDLRQRLLAETERRGFGPAILADLRGILRDSDIAEHPRLHRAALPVAAVFGARDEVIPVEAADLLRAWNPEAQITILDNADHGLPYTHPEAVVRAFEALSDDFL